MKCDAYELILLIQESVSMDEALKAELPSPRVAVFSSATKKQFFILWKRLFCVRSLVCPLLYLWLLLLIMYLIWSILNL